MLHGFALQSCKSILQSKDENTNVFMVVLVIYIEHIIGVVYDIFDDNIKNYINQIGPNIATPRRNGGVTPGFLPKMSVFLWLDHAWKFSQTLRTWQQEESDLADLADPTIWCFVGEVFYRNKPLHFYADWDEKSPPEISKKDAKRVVGNGILPIWPHQILGDTGVILSCDTDFEDVHDGLQSIPAP